jgi:hypothetical protein
MRLTLPIANPTFWNTQAPPELMESCRSAVPSTLNRHVIYGPLPGSSGCDERTTNWSSLVGKGWLPRLWKL